MGRLRNILLAGLLIGQLMSCADKSNGENATHLTGDLYFKLISIGSFYKADSLTITKFTNYFDSLKHIDNDSLTKEDIETIKIFDGLREKGLIEKPFFHLKVDSLTEYMVYMDTVEYKKIKDFNRQDLINENKKVIIDLTGDKVSIGPLTVIDCKTIDRVKKVDGKTYWRK